MASSATFGSSENSTSNPTRASGERSAVTQFALVFGMFLMVIGTFGNLATMVVIVAYKAMRSSTRLLFFSLASVDQVTLVLAEVRYWIIAFSEEDIRNNSTFTCKMHTFCTYAFKTQSKWLLTLISLERMCLTYFATRSHPFNHCRHVVLMIIIVCVMNAFKNFFYLFLELDGGQCGKIPFIKTFFTEITDLIFGCLLPFAVALVATLMILCKAFRQKWQQTQSNARMRSTTAMLVGVVVLRLIFDLPAYLFIVFAQSDLFANCDPELLLSIGTCLLTLAITNYAGNFYVYLLSASGFRRVFFGLCRTATSIVMRNLTTRVGVQPT